MYVVGDGSRYRSKFGFYTEDAKNSGRAHADPENSQKNCVDTRPAAANTPEMGPFATATVGFRAVRARPALAAAG